MLDEDLEVESLETYQLYTDRVSINQVESTLQRLLMRIMIFLKCQQRV
jgi:hypothetical protein